MSERAAYPLLHDFVLSGCPVVTSTINYLADMDVRPVFHAQRRERDNLVWLAPS